MGSPVKTSYTFRNGTEGHVTFSENSISSNAAGEILDAALVELADHQLLEGRELTSFESAVFIKDLTGLDYEKTFG